jgi:hypothetical protein
MSDKILPGWVSARTAGDGSVVGSIPSVNAIDREADQFPLNAEGEGINTPIAPPSREADRDWSSGGKGPGQTDRVGGSERI